MIHLIYERFKHNNLYENPIRYDFMSFNYPRQLIRFLKYGMRNVRIVEIK